MSDYPGILRMEPFRLFFPLGYLLAVLGLGLWILDYLEPNRLPPGEGHAILMMQGFAFSFAVGILLTDLRKSFDVADPPHLVHLSVVPALLLATAAAALARETGLSQLFFTLAAAGVCLSLALTFVLRRQPAHPDFLFSLAAVLSALGGSVLWMLAEAGVLSPDAGRFGRLAAFQAFFFCFAFATFHGEPTALGAADRPRTSPAAVANVLVLLVLFAALALEAFGPSWFPELATFPPAAANAAKAGLVLWFLRRRAAPMASPWPRSARWALLVAVAGLLLAAAFPGKSVALSHITYVGGFGWLVLARASGMVTAGAPTGMSFATRGSVSIYGSLLLLGALLRTVADFAPGSRPALLLLAAAFVLVPIVLWAMLFLPSLGSAERAGEGTRGRTLPA